MMKKVWLMAFLWLVNMAQAGLYVGAGVGMTHHNDELNTDSNVVHGGEALMTGSLILGYQPIQQDARKNNFFIDFGLNLAPQDNILSTESSVDYNVKTDAEVTMRIGSMFAASKNLYPYIFGALVYDLGVNLDGAGSVTSTTSSQDIMGFGGGVGVRGFAGEHGFYDFSYLYHHAADESFGTYTTNSDPINYTINQGLFVAAIGYMF